MKKRGDRFVFCTGGEITDREGGVCEVKRVIGTGLGQTMYGVEFADGWRMNAFDDELHRVPALVAMKEAVDAQAVGEG